MRRTGRDAAVSDRALGIMERQLQQLVGLTDDLLDVSRITRNRVELRRERIDLPNQPLWVYADFTRVAQAFSNLLNDAVKYTDRGGRISVSATVDGREAVVTLSDTGIGIDPKVLPFIFDMFMQVDQGPSRSRSGLGIGLTLARRLIELHEGRIEASSDGCGAGTTFRVRLPLVTAVAEQKRLDPVPLSHRPHAGCWWRKTFRMRRR
jgi:signal transduction histidine kinase